MGNKYAIIEIGSNNTKLHIYEAGNLILDLNKTIELKKNYIETGNIIESDINKLYEVIEETLSYTKNIYIFGCNIFREITESEVEEFNNKLNEKYHLKVQVVSQEEEADYTAIGCYKDIDYPGSICIFIGGGGSIELIFVNNKKVIDKKYYSFGVVDVTKKFPSLKEDRATCTFDEVYEYITALINNLNQKADILILAGGDHLYWYHNAEYKLLENKLYKNEKQKYMLTREMCDEYDKDALKTSLNRIRNNSDNPSWFDGSRAMKVITNLIAHKIDAKYIIPTKINMEDGIEIK